MKVPGRVCIVGNGSWGTALAKIVVENSKRINWFIRKSSQIDEFYKLGHNPTYLTNLKFNLSKITFYSNISKAIKESDTIILAVPSPYVKQTLRWVWASEFKDKFVISALKGIVGDTNLLVSQFLASKFNIPEENIGAISGPCHAEEVAMERLSFLTVASKDSEKAQLMAETIRSRFMHSLVSDDVLGIELAAVLKNIYALAAGICKGLQFGDNFQAVLMSNCAKEMTSILNAVYPMERNICEPHYLGDMLATGYSQFSRNRTFGIMIGEGYSVKSAQIEMEMIVEGYYGAAAVKSLSDKLNLDMPISETVYKILYEKVDPQRAINALIDKF